MLRTKTGFACGRLMASYFEQGIKRCSMEGEE